MDKTSGITWFDDDKWIGSEVVFGASDQRSRWILNQKLSERESFGYELDVKNVHLDLRAQAVFLCSSIDDIGREAILRIRMQ
jgi:hypothetical protein